MKEEEVSGSNKHANVRSQPFITQSHQAQQQLSQQEAQKYLSPQYIQQCNKTANNRSMISSLQTDVIHHPRQQQLTVKHQSHSQQPNGLKIQRITHQPHHITTNFIPHDPYHKSSPMTLNANLSPTYFHSNEYQFITYPTHYQQIQQANPSSAVNKTNQPIVNSTTHHHPTHSPHSSQSQHPSHISSQPPQQHIQHHTQQHGHPQNVMTYAHPQNMIQAMPTTMALGQAYGYSNSSTNGLRDAPMMTTMQTTEDGTLYHLPPGMTQKRSSKKGRKVTKQACVHCRKAHACCSETRPCTRCVKNDLECIDIAGKKRGRKKKKKSDDDDSDHTPTPIPKVRKENPYLNRNVISSQAMPPTQTVPTPHYYTPKAFIPCPQPQMQPKRTLDVKEVEDPMLEIVSRVEKKINDQPKFVPGPTLSFPPVPENASKELLMQFLMDARSLALSRTSIWYQREYAAAWEVQPVHFAELNSILSDMNKNHITVVVAARSGLIISMSQGLFNLLGYERESDALMAIPSWDYLFTPDTVVSIYRSPLQTQYSHCKLKVNNQHHQLVNVLLKPVRDTSSGSPLFFHLTLTPVQSST